MVSVTSLALSRIRHHKSRTILTAVAIMLMTMLLMGLGTSVMGLVDLNRQQASASGNAHAVLNDLNVQQITVLENHKDVESLETFEVFATVEYGKMNGFLTYGQELKEGIYHGVGNLVEGREPQSADEISASKAFFKRIDVEPVIGTRFSLSFRPGGEGQVETREFVISGILSEIDTSQMDISDSRIVYGANVSESLIREFFSPNQREYTANIRAVGEDSLNYDEITAEIDGIAADIGCDADHVNYNSSYLYAMTDPGSEMTAIVCGITFLIIFFSGLVIYSIYYVCVITDVQEIGKLKAIGASKKQVWKMLLTEGFFVSLMALPPGLVIGFLIPRQCFPVIVQKGVAAMAAAPVGDLDMFSFPVLLLVIFVVLFTVSISLLKPMRLASKISPMEAIRYQESKVDGKKRKLNKDKPVNLFSLTAANLMRNKKRTVVTMVTMGLSCVLFMSLSGVLNSADPEDIARRNIPEGDFSLFLECEWNDKEYPENNLNYVQKSDYFNGDFVDSLRSLPGVEKVTVKESVLIGSDNSDSELFEKGRRVDLSHFDKDEAREYEKELKRGNIDYDAMVAENGALFTSDIFMDDYGFSVGDIVSLTVYDGDRKIPLDITISGSLNSGDSSYFMIPEEVYQKLNLTTNTATDLYITVNEKQYEAVKSTLQEFTDANAFFRFYSMDEELKIGRMAVNVIKYPMYLILMMVALISFMNLINTMITSIVTRKREMGMLQAIGLSNRQLKKMIAGEGLVFTCGTLIVSVTVGNFFGYLLFLWAKANKFMSISNYHYPFVETLVLVGLLLVGQVLIGYFINKRIQKESLIERIRSGE